MLGTARCAEFLSADVRSQVFHLLRKLEVDSLVAVGGNGTLAGAQRFAAEHSLQVIGIPATIDNDIPITETALGFDTAVNNTMRAIEQLNDSAASHHRIIVVETMGRDCGHLARLASLAAGAEIVVVPERGPLTKENMGRIARRLRESLVRGQTHAMVVVAEGVKTEEPSDCGPAVAMRRFLEQHFSRLSDVGHAVEVRDVVLGHLQRGGGPTAADRILAAQLANAAWGAIMRKPPRSGAIVVRGGRAMHRPLNDDAFVGAAGVYDTAYCVHKAVTRWV